MKRRRHDATFKSKVALELVKREKTLAQLAGEYGVHPNRIWQWRKRLLKGLTTLFSDKGNKKDRDELETELYRSSYIAHNVI